MFTEKILECRDKSILIAEEKTHGKIVVAVPHHSSLGNTKLPCEFHRCSDENAGFLGYYLACLLNCHSIIACNYYIDPNKFKESDYFKRINSWNPNILVEIHGHSGKSSKFDIEISSGSEERNRWSLELAKKLRLKLAEYDLLKQYTISGDYNIIYYKASKSKTIITKNWIPFHIELPKSIRSSEPQYKLFCEVLAEILLEILNS